MTAHEKDHLAELTNQVTELTRTVQSMSTQLNQNTKDTAAIKLTLAGWSGGRKTLVWVVGVLLTMGVILSSLYATAKAAIK